MAKLGALQWQGGKSSAPGNNTGIGKWVSSLLPPPESSQTYCEPFAGMLGILLQREPAGREIVNDLDNNVINWWRCVRDKPKKLSKLIQYTPNSREEVGRCLEVLESDIMGLERALAFTVVVTQLHSYTARSKSSFRTRWQARGQVDWRGGIHKKLLLLADRIQNVTIENMDAVTILNRMAHVDESVIYVDPPYYSLKKGIYRHSDIDVEELTRALLRQQGRVAVSGYGEEWDHLNWEKYTKRTIAPRGGSRHNETAPKKTECLWTNYIAEV